MAVPPFNIACVPRMGGVARNFAQDSGQYIVALNRLFRHSGLKGQTLYFTQADYVSLQFNSSSSGMLTSTRQRALWCPRLGGERIKLGIPRAKMALQRLDESWCHPQVKTL